MAREKFRCLSSGFVCRADLSVSSQDHLPTPPAHPQSPYFLYPSFWYSSGDFLFTLCQLRIYLGTDPFTHNLLASFCNSAEAGPSKPEQAPNKLLQAEPAPLTGRANPSHPVGSWKILGLANKNRKGPKPAKTNNAVSPEPPQRSAVKVESPTLPAEIGIPAGKDGRPVGKGEPSGSPVVSSKLEPPPRSETPSDLG